MKKKLCKNCDYIDELRDLITGEFVPVASSDKDDTRGSCKRFPEKVIKQGNDWCGEFKEKA